jgi:hypothetical protein
MNAEEQNSVVYHFLPDGEVFGVVVSSIICKKSIVECLRRGLQIEGQGKCVRLAMLQQEENKKKIHPKNNYQLTPISLYNNSETSKSGICNLNYHPISTLKDSFYPNCSLSVDDAVLAWLVLADVLHVVKQNQMLSQECYRYIANEWS